MSTKFKVKLKGIHEESDITLYRVSKDTNLPLNTVKRYAKHEPIISRLEATVLTLCEYYGVDWRDPEIVEVIDEDEESLEIESLLVAIA